MKNFSILTLLAALLFVGCSDIFVEIESPLTNETTLPDLTANFADDGLTRTYVEAGKYLRWHEADLITAFFGNTLNRQYKFNGATGANSGTFSLVPNGELGTGNTLDAIYAIYPYDGKNAEDHGKDIQQKKQIPFVHDQRSNPFQKASRSFLTHRQHLRA